MPEVIFTGPAGRLEGRFHPSKQRGAPIAVILHPHPQFGGTMNNQIVYNLYYAFAERGFSVLRFNFRGVGRSQGSFDHGQGELSDAAAALDWVQSINPEARACWIAGASFGSWIGMQLLMRRPEIEGFISIAPPANRFDYSFLAPCPSSGLFVHGDQDRVAPLKEVMALIEKLKTQKGIVIEHAVIEGANHFFENRVDELIEEVGRYLDRRLDEGAMIDRHHWRPLAPCGHIGGAEIEGDRDAEAPGQQGAIADLDREMLGRPVQHGLAMETDDIDLSGGEAVVAQKAFDRLAVALRHHGFAGCNRFGALIASGERDRLRQRGAQQGAVTFVVGQERCGALPHLGAAIGLDKRHVDTIHGGAGHEADGGEQGHDRATCESVERSW